MCDCVYLCMSVYVHVTICENLCSGICIPFVILELCKTVKFLIKLHKKVILVIYAKLLLRFVKSKQFVYSSVLIHTCIASDEKLFPTSNHLLECNFKKIRTVVLQRTLMKEYLLYFNHLDAKLFFAKLL